MSKSFKKFWKALKCPICGARAVFYVTKDAVKDANQYPVPFQVIHEDHNFMIFLDSGLLISRIEEPKVSTPTAPKKKTKSKKTK